MTFSKSMTRLILFVFIFSAALMMCSLSNPAMAAGGPGTYDNSIGGSGDSGNMQDEIDRIHPGNITIQDNAKPEEQKAPAKKEKPAKESKPVQVQQQKTESVRPDMVKAQSAPVKQSPVEPAAVKTVSQPKAQTVQIDKSSVKKGLTLRFLGETLQFSEKPVAIVKGKVYISANDPDFKRFFDKMGLTYSWMSFSGRFFVYMRTGSIKWDTKTNKATVGDKEVSVPETVRADFGEDYIPLDSLAELLNLDVTGGSGVLDIKPRMSIASEISGEQKTLNILFTAASELKYTAQYQANPPSLRLKIPGAGYRKAMDKLFVEGVEIRINNSVDKDNLFVTVEFPPHWRGEIAPGGNKNEIAVRMKPNISYAWGAKNEVLNSIKVAENGNQVYALFETSNKVNYYWAYDQDEGVLYLDVPLCKTAARSMINGYKSGVIKKMEVVELQPDGVDITRIRIDLQPGAAFMIGPPEKQKGHAFALLVGPGSEISSPSPAVGGSGTIIMASGDESGIIVIDPGHGGSDPGACNGGMGLREKDITLDISRRLAGILSKNGWKVYLTRNTDTDLTYPGSPDRDELQARADVANRLNASAFISIHCNASVSNGLRGSSYHWCKEIDRELAKSVEGCLGTNIGTSEKGSRRDRFYVLSHTKVPAVLVETAFLSNSQDASILGSEEYRQKIAEQLAKAISDFVRNSNMAKKNRNDQGE
ncbi:MAG: N-acetylmuramoyl-L-alanine amidase [Firmicutes bacterium]|nr:N-acetylmuramoyl-L-alanine amidase [Bacillota bacterium]